MYKSATKCNKTIGKWCKNKHGASKIIDTFETYHQAGKSYGLMRQVSALEDKVYGLVARVMHLKECDSYLVEIIESPWMQLKCEFFYIPSRISCCFSWLYILMNLRLPGTCLHPTDEDLRVFEQIAAQHIGEAVNGCQRSLTTMYSVMLPIILRRKVLSSYLMLLGRVNEFIA
jgi:hypothetical protein